MGPHVPSNTTFEERLSHFGNTDVGAQRTENQDNWGFASPAETGAGWLFVVADGMGGAKGGRVASQIAVDVIKASYIETMRTQPECGVFDAIRHAVELANHEVHSRSDQPETMGMGTTVTVLVVRGDLSYTAHVGDSRIYRFRDGRLEQMTRDHTRVQELVDQGIITPGLAKKHPQGHIIARNLGSRAQVEVDIPPDGPFRLREGDVFMLCSDGLYGMVDDEAIRQVLKVAPPIPCTNALIKLANMRGGADNITVCTVCAGQGPALWDDYTPEALGGLIDDHAEDASSDTAVFNVHSRDSLEPSDFETEQLQVSASERAKLKRRVDASIAARKRRDSVQPGTPAPSLADARHTPSAEIPSPAPRSATPGPTPSAAAAVTDPMLEQSQPRPSPVGATTPSMPETPARKSRPWLLIGLLLLLAGAILLVLLGIAFVAVQKNLVSIDGLNSKPTVTVSAEPEPSRASKKKKKRRVAKSKARKAPVKAERPPSCSEGEETLPYTVVVTGRPGTSHVLVDVRMPGTREKAPSCSAATAEVVHLPPQTQLAAFSLPEEDGSATSCRARFGSGNPITIELDCG